MSETLLFLSIIVPILLASYEDCGYNFVDEGVTFDLSPLTLTASSNRSYYGVQSGNYLYAFNLCQHVINPGITIDGECIFGNDYRVGGPDGIESRPGNTSSMAFQNGNGQCFRIAGSLSDGFDDLITYSLFDEDDPALGVTIHYNYGDYGTACGAVEYSNRQFDITFICDPDADNIIDSGLTIEEGPTCQYTVEINSIYGCPSECGRGSDGSLCSNFGQCGYDFDKGTARCYCYGGFEGDACEIETKFYGDKAWYDEISTANDSILVTFETQFNYNITYDLQYLIDGYLSDNYYKLTNINKSREIYFRLLEEIEPYIDDTLCLNNDDFYNYGYIFEIEADNARAECYSLGRDQPNIMLYDENLPARGISIEFSNGDTGILGEDGSTCYSNAQSVINFICPDTNQYERYDSIQGLNPQFQQYTFSDLFNCRRQVDIFTSAACPYQCITEHVNKNAESISQCFANGVCAYDVVLNTARCLCNDNVNITTRDDIFCEHPDLTYSPSMPPTEEPTLPPFVTYYEDVEVDTSSEYLYTLETLFGYNITYDLQYFVKGYETDIDSVFTGYKLLYGDYAYYLNVFNKTIGSDKLSGVCDSILHGEGSPSYDYGYIFQTAKDDSNSQCLSLGRDPPVISLYDEADPTRGITLSYESGEPLFCQGGKQRRSEINLICPDDGGQFETYPLNLNVNDWAEPVFCEYSLDIITSTACPAKCIVNDIHKSEDIISVCSTNGVCQYKNSFALTVCDCFGDPMITSPEDIFCNINITFPPSNEPTVSPTTGQPSTAPTLAPIRELYKDNVADKSSPYVETFPVGDYNVSYDLRYILDGYLTDDEYQYYKLEDATSTHYYYFNLFESRQGSDSVMDIGCGSNNPTYDYGYMFQQNIAEPDLKCNSLGRDEPVIELYDTDNPLSGIKILFQNGDARDCPGSARAATVNFVCPNDDSVDTGYERYSDSDGLNSIFSSSYKFSEPSTCAYEITIYTSSACPYQCAYYEPDRPSISLCSTNGICIYDDIYDVVRCDCNDDIVIDSIDDLYCSEDVTYPPTNNPTLQPTSQPTQDPTRTRNPTSDPTKAPTERYGLWGEWDYYNPNDDISWQVNIEVDYHCQYVKFTQIMSANLTGHWFGFGIGGNYIFDDIESGEDDESIKMNGYALITRIGQESYEVTLEPGEKPEAQQVQNLDCTVEINDNLQTTICYRELYDGDDNDFNEFKNGYNPIAWAHGLVNPIDDTISYHDQNAEAGNAYKIYLKGDNPCYTMSSTQDMDQANIGDGSGDDDTDNTWMIIAIIFIVLAIIFLLVIGYLYYDKKQNQPGYIHGRAVSTDGGGGTAELTSIDDDGDTPNKRTGDAIATAGDAGDATNEKDDLL